MATKMVQRRNVVVVGKTGAGKSTVANKISGYYNFEVKASYESVTREVSLTEASLLSGNTEYLFKIIDTVGFFDTKTNNIKVLRGMKTFFQEKVPEGVNLVLFVFKGGRFTKEEKDTFDFLKENFQNIISDATALVITNCDNLNDEGREKAIKEFKENETTREAAKFMKKGIYAVGFPDVRGMASAVQTAYKESMKADEEKLRKLVMDSSKMYLSKEMFQQTFWETLGSCTIL